MPSKTVLVIGANGFVGSNVVNYLRKRHKVIAAFNRNVIKFPGVTHIMYMLDDRDYMKRVITHTKPDAIVYCAGVTDFVDCAKRPQGAEVVNSFGPVVITAASETVTHRFIYVSTAYVYDGKKGNFSEVDTVLPETHFAKGKLTGENYVRSKSQTHTILRFAPLYGIGSVFHHSRFDEIRMRLELGLRVELPQNEMHNFLSMDVGLKAIEWCVTQESRNHTYNLGGLTKMSWYDFGLMMAESFGFDKSLIVPGGVQFEGDRDFSLNGSELVRQLEVDPLILEQGLDLLKQQLVR